MKDTKNAITGFALLDAFTAFLASHCCMHSKGSSRVLAPGLMQWTSGKGQQAYICQLLYLLNPLLSYLLEKVCSIKKSNFAHVFIIYQRIVGI